MTAIADVRMIRRTSADGRYHEALASGICSPGQVLERDADLKVKRCTTAGKGNGPLIVALENALLGVGGGFDIGIQTDYAVGDVVPHVYPQPGDILAMRIAANAPAITKGNVLICNGAGSLIKASVTGGVIFNKVASSTAVSNTVSTEQDYDSTGTIPANTLKAGDIINIKGSVVVSAAAGTDTITVKVYLGATVIALSAAVNGTTGDVISFEVDVVIRTAGASGTYVAHGFIGNGVVGTGAVVVTGVASTAIDTTAAIVVKASSTWSATTATCTSALTALSAVRTSTNPQSPLFQAEETIDSSASAVETFIDCLVL
jgi:hypothetical protein